MYSLVYISFESKKLTEEDLTKILVKSRSNNAQLDITGMLLYVDGIFIQILEGKRENVLKVFEKIIKDSRHTKIVKVNEVKDAERIFPSWSMGFQSTNFEELKTITGYKNLSIDSLTFNDDKLEDHPTLIFFKKFYQNYKKNKGILT